MRKSYEYTKISDYELGKEITKEFFKDFFHPEGFFPRLIWEILKDPTGMLMDLPLEARITSYNVCYTKLLRISL